MVIIVESPPTKILGRTRASQAFFSGGHAGPQVTGEVRVVIRTALQRSTPVVASRLLRVGICNKQNP